MKMGNIKSVTAGLFWGVAALAITTTTSHATVLLQVSEEIFTGGSSGTSVTDENELFSPLSTGFGGASLAALRVYNESDSYSNNGYHNRASWRISDVVFSADAPGTDSATVGIGGQLTAVLDGASAAGIFKGGFAEVSVGYSFFYFDSFGTPQSGSGTLFQQREQADGDDPILEFGAEIDQFVGTTLTFPVDIPITLSMMLTASAGYSTVNPGDGGFAIADASNTLSFNPDQFFAIDAGITANAGNFIVDNSLPFFAMTAIPEPASLAVFAMGLLALSALRRTRHQRR